MAYPQNLAIAYSSRYDGILLNCPPSRTENLSMPTLRPAFLLLTASLCLLHSPPAAEPQPETRVALERLKNYAAGQKPADRKLVFVYFTPSDRDPPDGFRERLTRVMTDIQKFYADEMERHGFGRRTIRFDRDDHGQAVFHVVKGKHPAADYLEDNGGQHRRRHPPRVPPGAESRRHRRQ